ncbi:MAG: polymer-forming cytoskeletal protein [Desulfuromonadales bacterium]|uniref:bactofilin family protein n=1 Tax=Desulfuromonas sp. KJ2020 TaxID=2919173 RepID=UPI000325E6D4|nr:polymer-forming cytoskeletal protein [Desulfuromonas sp. KJ2020]MCP3176176.1 polymer-forming cytoskeletal protein [Desulfuromonas sp. KJ2020]
MFTKKEDNAMKKETPIEKREIKAFLGPGSEFEGKLVFDDIVRLDGAFRGEIASKDTLIVGEAADIQAEITVGSLILSGRFKGNIKASSRVELRNPAMVEGNIETPVLIVEEGVRVNSNISMKVEKGATPTPVKDK